MTICKFVHSETYDLVVDVRQCPVYLKRWRSLIFQKMKLSLLILLVVSVTLAAPRKRKHFVNWNDMSNWHYRLLKTHQEKSNVAQSDYLAQIKRHLERERPE